jgi:DNA-binding response OmpR family regulator
MEQSNAKRVLVVDDEEDILTVVEQMLQQLNTPADSFTDPEEALRSFRANPTRYSLIISDFRMPRMSGLDFIHSIRQLHSTVNIVVISAFDPTREETDSFIVNLGVKEILVKPFNFAQFISVIRRILQP